MFFVIQKPIRTFHTANRIYQGHSHHCERKLNKLICFVFYTINIRKTISKYMKYISIMHAVCHYNRIGYTYKTEVSPLLTLSALRLFPVFSLYHCFSSVIVVGNS